MGVFIGLGVGDGGWVVTLSIRYTLSVLGVIHKSSTGLLKLIKCYKIEAILKPFVEVRQFLKLAGHCILTHRAPIEADLTCYLYSPSTVCPRVFTLIRK